MPNVCIPKDRITELKTQLQAGQLKGEDIVKLLPGEQKAIRSMLESMVSTKLGVKVKSIEIQKINQLAKKIDAAQVKLGPKLGSPDSLAENIEFFKAKKAMDDYLNKLNPSPNLRILTGTIGRGMLLFSVKSPILNIGSNIEIGIAESISRRIVAGSVKSTDNKLARDYIKMVNKVYQETGYDLSRMVTLNDNGANGMRVLDETVSAQGKGLVRKVGRGVEDVVFKQLMGAPDVVSGAIHFADSVNINALKAVKGNTAKAKALMADAMKIAPETPEGELLRAQGILDAQVATWTNKSWASDLSLGIRKILNKLSGDLRAGDYLLPFVKTPANVVSTGLDYAGLGIPKAMFKTVQAMRSGNLKDKAFLQSASRDIVRSGLGLTGAVILASQIDDDSFMGAYDPNRAQIAQLKNSRENSIKIGDKWISTDWFGPLSVSMNGILYARKYGDGKADLSYQYAKGTTSSILNLPGVKDVSSYVAAQKQKDGEKLGDAKEEAVNYATEEAYARLVPSFISDIAKATDTKERVGGKGLEGIKSKIPIVRNDQPAKKTIFGNEIKTESPASTILFGARVKTDTSTPITKEIDRINRATDKNVNFTDWNKSTAKDLSEFKKKVGQDKYDEATTKYGQELKKELQSIMRNGNYNKLDDDDKYKVLSNADAKIKKQVLKSYDFKATKTKSSSLVTKFR